MLQGHLSSAREAGVLNIRSPAEGLVGWLALMLLLRLRLLWSGGINLVNLRIDSTRK
jgi:hypothetical protein